MPTPERLGQQRLNKQISASTGEAAGTHQPHIVDHFVFVTSQCINGVSVEGKGHSLQSLVLGVHADVRLHLNTPQTSVWISFRATKNETVIFSDTMKQLYKCTSVVNSPPIWRLLGLEHTVPQEQLNKRLGDG